MGALGTMTRLLPDPQFSSGALGGAVFGTPEACTLADLPRAPIDWTNDAQRRLEDIELTAARIEEGIQ